MMYLFCLLTSLLCANLHSELFFTQEMISSHLKGYTSEEVLLLKKDLTVVRSICFDNTHNTPTRFYLATAGAPGARKTTILDKFVANHPEYQQGVYLDPDSRALKFMAHTYYNHSLNALVISRTSNYDEVIKNAYDKWRGGSNYIALSLLEEAHTLGRSIIYGATSTGGHISSFFGKLKENNYQIVLLLCSSPDQMRYDAIDYRNRTIRFYQSSPEDALTKGVLFSQRMGDYFSYADQLYFYWSDGLFSSERLAAIWSKDKLEIYDADAMNRFIDKYETDRLTLQKTGVSIPAFETYLTKGSIHE